MSWVLVQRLGERKGFAVERSPLRGRVVIMHKGVKMGMANDVRAWPLDVAMRYLRRFPDAALWTDPLT